MMGEAWTQGMVVLATVVGGLLLLWLGLHRWQMRHNGRMLQRLSIRLLQRIPLGNRREILVVQIEDRLLVLGVTDQQFTVLQQWALKDYERATVEEEVSVAEDYSFRAFLRSLRKQVLVGKS